MPQYRRVKAFRLWRRRYMGGTTDFIRDLWRMPSTVRAWLMVLGISNMMIPLLLIRHIEAKIMLLCTILGFIIGVQMHKRKGMTRILGLMHLPWLFAIFFLIKAIITRGVFDLYGLWMVMALLLISISLTIDIRDATRYYSGETDSII